MKRSDIQIYRALSVAAVLLYHSNLSIFKWLYLGVDAFFVISGYLMAALYLDAPARKFYSKRIRRLYPSLILTLVFVNLYSCWKVFPLDFHAIFQSSILGALGLANFYFVSQQSYFDTVNFQPLLHLWSLAVEIQFYVITPLIFRIFRKYKNISLGSLAILSLIFTILTEILISEKYSFFLPFGRAWEFIAGILAFTIAKQIRGITFWFVFIVLISSILLVPETFTHLLIRVTVCFILSVMLKHNFSNSLNFKYAKIPVWFGGISYELYLVHFPFIALMSYEPLTSNTTARIEKLSDWIIYLAGSITIATLVQRLSKFVATKHGRFIWISLVAITLTLTSLNVAKPTILHGTKEATLSSSLEDYNRRRCNLIERVREYKSKVCLVSGSNADTERILLVGDSFANSLKDELEKVSNSVNAALYINKDNSQLVDGDMVTTLNYLKQIRATSLILHSSNTLNPTQSTQLESFALSHPTIKFVVIGPTPIFKFNVAKQILREIESGSPAITVSPRDLANIRDINNSRILKSENILSVSLVGRLCDPDCKYSNSNLSANYFDNGHITNRGANNLNATFIEISNFLQNGTSK
jgi:peptidoglycan/LPS O-acetylase OafA/YrhL